MLQMDITVLQRSTADVKLGGRVCVYIYWVPKSVFWYSVKTFLGINDILAGPHNFKLLFEG